MTVAAAAVAAVPAHGAIAPTLHMPANCAEIDPTPGVDDHPSSGKVFKCDDGVPMAGGLAPNLSGASAITVPAKYGGDGFTELPPKAADAAATAGASPADGTVGLDVNITLPDTPPPAAGYPLLFFMHGCCSGDKANWEASAGSPTIDGRAAPAQGSSEPGAFNERWHYNNLWFASRGYVVVTYTARGFINNQNRGSSGQSLLDSRSFEINDYQHLACQVFAAADGPAAALDDIVPGVDVEIDPQNVVATGGSYGGGFAWLALTDPNWTCDPLETGTAVETDMGLSVIAPRYGWTDLAYTLVPNGMHSQLPGESPATNGCTTGPLDLNGQPCPGGGAPVGVPKASIVSALFVTGNSVQGNHTTFAPEISEAFACLQASYPLENNPACANTLATTLPRFMRERSAYYQNDFFAKIAGDATYRIPVFNSGTLTDPLFPAYENRRMVNRLLATVPGYPVQQYYGDYQHFVQNKAKEWGDICDTGGEAGRRVCAYTDYPGGDYNAAPSGRQRIGATSRLNDFVDHYAKPSANPAEPTPSFDVTAALQVCEDNAGTAPVDEPGDAFTATTFEQLAPNTLSVELPGGQETLSKVPVNPHAANADPFGNLLSNGGECPTETSVAGVGIASYSSDPLPAPATMIGATRATVDLALTGSSNGLQLNARLYDLSPNGSAALVDRGPRRITAAEAASGIVRIELHGNGWRFGAGHRIRIELAQDDTPFVRATDEPSSLELTRVSLAIPVREASSTIGGGADKKPDCGNRISGTNKRNRLKGTKFGDQIDGLGGKDRLKGARGADCLSGGNGNDRLGGGRGADELAGGKGNDRIAARDGVRDRVNCGRGKHDRAKVDRKDRVRESCERVKRKKRK